MTGGGTDDGGDLAHGIVAHVEVAEALALDEAQGQRGEQVVREGQALNLGADYVDDVVGQAGNVLMAQVDGDAWLLWLLWRMLRLLCQLWLLWWLWLWRGGGVDGGGGAVASVLARVLKGSLGEGEHVGIGHGRGSVEAHAERGSEGEGRGGGGG